MHAIRITHDTVVLKRVKRLWRVNGRGRVRYDAGLGRFRFRLLAVALAVAAGQGEQLHEQQRLHAQGHELRGDEPRVA